MNDHDLRQRLIPLYEAGEAEAIVRWVLDVRFGLSWADILCGKVEALSADRQRELEEIMLRLEKGEPVQYVLGVADFCGRQFHVEPGVLIPRPETAELCRWIMTQGDGLTQGDGSSVSLLDIGTGSGCIAVTLALEMPETKVTAWDISDDALRIAQKNATLFDASVSFRKQDALNPPNDENRWDLIVSNPPYICDREKATMAQNVTGYEPHLALFVPDDNPLRFYRAIAHYAVKALKTQGCLYFELNPLYAQETAVMLQAEGFVETEIRQDQYGKERFLKAMKI